MILATIGVLLSTLAAPQSEPTPREWNQPWGNAAGTSFVDVAPLASMPSEKWRLESTELLAGPIVTQRRLFAAVKLDGKAQLVALDPDSGAKLAAAPLDAVSGPLTLVGADGLVLLFDAKAAHGYRLSGGALTLEKSVAGSFLGPTWGGGVLLAGKPGGGVQQLDWSGGKAVALAAKGASRPSLRGGVVATFSVEEKESKLALLRWPATVSGGAIKLGALETAWSGGLIAPSATVPQAVLVGVPGREATDWCAWFGAGVGGGMVRKAGVHDLSFQAAPAAMGSRLYGFDAKEQLVEHDATSDGHKVLVEKAGLPTGGKPGAPSIARDVLYLGNWALELARKKVLWCKADLDVVGAVVPVADERIVVATSRGRLVGYGRAEAAAASGKPRIPAATPTVVPGKEPGLVRADGIFVPGKVTALEGGRWKVEPKGGAAQEYDAEWVALAESGDAPGKRTGEEIALHGAWWKVLAPAHAEGLVPAIEKYRDAKLVDEARALLEEAKRYGLAPDRADALGASIPAKGGAKGKAASDAKKACDEIVSDVRDASWKAFRAGARWCAERNSKVAASVLAARANELRPEETDLELIEDWVPSDFPEQAGLEERIKAWLLWADALLPSGGSFATIDDALRRRLSVTKFKEGEALVFRTRNILLFSRENDPKVIGPLLQRGEATIRALQKILGPSPQGLSPLTPLEVRLYRTKAEYLADGSSPPVWSAGCYSPNDKTSRFYSSMGDRKSDPVQHTLEEVFAHELTHHYTDLRWVREGGGKDPGSYWMVEGFAEFVAGQALEIGRMGDTFDDASAEAIDRCAAVARIDPSLLLDFQSFIDIDRARFHGGELEGMVGTFKLKHTLSETTVDKRLLFYAQATALTFFVMNQCGDEGRAAYVRWLESVYSGKPLQTPWKDLGMGSPGEWKGKFVAWLKEA